MKVAYVSGSYATPYDGVGQWAKNLVAQLTSYDAIDAIDVFTSSTDRRVDYPDDCGDNKLSNTSDISVRHHSVESWGVWTCLLLAWRIAAMGPEVVHIEYPTNAYGRKIGINLLPFFLRVLAWRSKVVLCLHEYRSYRLLGRLRIGLALGAVHAVVCPDDSNLRRIENILGLNRLRLKSVDVPPNLIFDLQSNSPETGEAALPSLPDDIAETIKTSTKRPETSRFTPRDFGVSDFAETDSGTGAEDSTVDVVYWGLAREGKGIETLVHALHVMNQRDGYDASPRVVLGADLDESDVYQAAVRDLVTDLNLNGQVNVAGFLPDEQVAKLLRATSLVVLPFDDGVSARRSTFMLSMQLGCAVITTERPESTGAPAGLNHKSNVWLVPPGDPEALAEAIHTLLNDPRWRAEVRANARRWAAEQGPSWSSVAASMTDLYLELTSIQ